MSSKCKRKNVLQRPHVRAGEFSAIILVHMVWSVSVVCMERFSGACIGAAYAIETQGPETNEARADEISLLATGLVASRQSTR